MRVSLLGTVMACILGFSTISGAALIDRGGGLIYETDLDTTWLQDANYAYTSGYDDDGRMTWFDALAWADQLVYGGYDNWRLPTSGIEDYSRPDPDWDITDSEIGYLYYVELGNEFGISGFTNTGPFINFQQEAYWWADTQYSYYQAWFFRFGGLGVNSVTHRYFAMAVLDGDVAAIPIPSSALLLGSGFLALIGFGWRRFKKA